MEEYHLGKTKVTYTHHYVFKYYSERYISTVANIIQNPNTREPGSYHDSSRRNRYYDLPKNSKTGSSIINMIL